MSEQNVKQFIGKTLREVKAIQPNVRVMQVGPVVRFGTCDYWPQRLNVRLGEENVKFSKKTIDICGELHTFEEVDGSEEDGIVVEAHWG